MTRREELERRLKNLSAPDNAVWIAIIFQVVAAAGGPPMAFAAIAIMLFWIFIKWLCRWATAHELDAAIRKEQQAEFDARDFIRDRAEAIAGRMQANLEAQIRAEALRNRMKMILDSEAHHRRQAQHDAIMNGRKTERFMGKAIDVTPEKS